MNERLASFEHPQKAFRLEYPAHWDHAVRDNGQSCGFGPRDRDDVGLWISIMPLSLDTDRLSKELPKIFRQALGESDAVNIRADLTLRHHGFKADIAEPDQGGSFWILAGGDLVLFASSQVPAAERATWNLQFDRVMSSLQITRGDELLMRKVSDAVMKSLREAHPEQNYEWDQEKIHGRDHVVYLGNVYREVAASPRRQEQIIRDFLKKLDVSAVAKSGNEPWDEVVGKLLPAPKPREYIQTEGPTQRLVKTDWLSDLIIVYAIRGDLIRFVTDWDLNRWGVDLESLHRRAIDNLTLLPWPQRLEGSRDPGGGRLIMVATNDSFDASRLLHPDLHRLLSDALGSPFLAAIPDRDTLVTFSDEPQIRQRLAQKVKEDYVKSSHAVTPLLFLVTAAGVALAGTSKREDWGIVN